MPEYQYRLKKFRYYEVAGFFFLEAVLYNEKHIVPLHDN